MDEAALQAEIMKGFQAPPAPVPGQEGAPAGVTQWTLQVQVEATIGVGQAPMPGEQGI